MYHVDVPNSHWLVDFHRGFPPCTQPRLISDDRSDAKLHRSIFLNGQYCHAMYPQVCNIMCIELMGASSNLPAIDPYYLSPLKNIPRYLSPISCWTAGCSWVVAASCVVLFTCLVGVQTPNIWYATYSIIFFMSWNWMMWQFTGKPYIWW